MSQQVAVKKGTKEFSDARHKLLDLFFNRSAKDDYYVSNNGLGSRSKVVDAHLSEIPMPFGCPSLLINPTMENEKVTGIIWFCSRDGCICVCCREDFTGEKERYPDYCPPVNGFEPEPDCDCGSSTCDICNPGWDQQEEGVFE